MPGPRQLPQKQLRLVAALLCLLATSFALPQGSQAQAAPGDQTGEPSLYAAPHCPAAKFACRVPSFTLDPSGRLYFATSSCVFRVEGPGRYKALAALPAPGVWGGPVGLAADNSGNVFIADFDLHQVRKVAADGTISVVARDPAADTSVDRPQSPQSLAIDSDGNLYIAEVGNPRVREIQPDGTMTTLVTGKSGRSLALDGNGNLYIGNGARVYKRTPTGLVTSVAGNDTPKYSGEHGPATKATLFADGVAVDANGILYIADSHNRRILKIAADGTISTIAGEAGVGFSGDGGPARDAKIGLPQGVAADHDGNVYFVDFWAVDPQSLTFSCDTVVIRKISAAEGTISTVVGGWGITLR